MPPQETTQTYARREQLEAIGGFKSCQIPLTVKAGTKVRRGVVIGIVTADGYVRERTRSLAKGTGFADNSPTGQVEDGSLFKVGDVLKNEAGDTIGTVLGVDLTTTPDTITLNANAAVNVAVDDAVLGSDGSQVAKGIADEAVVSTEAKDTVLSPIIGGALKQNLLVGLDDSAKAELGGVSFPGNVFKF